MSENFENVEMPISNVANRDRSRPSFRPISRTNSVVNRDRQVETQTRSENDTIPLSELIKKNAFGLKVSGKSHDKDDDKVEDNDEIVGNTNFEDAGEASDFINVFKEFDDDMMREEGFEQTNRFQKAEFNEKQPKRFGSRIKKSTPRWKQEETDFFYHVLSMCGTDFSMMSKFFTNRSRRMIVNKFHVESEHNSERVKQSLENREPLDLSLYATAVGVDEGSIVEDYKKNKSKLVQPISAPTVQPRKVVNSNSDSDKNSSDELTDVSEDEDMVQTTHTSNNNSDGESDSDVIEGDLNF